MPPKPSTPVRRFGAQGGRPVRALRVAPPPPALPRLPAEGPRVGAKRKGGMAAAKKKAQRESKLVPSLVFYMEEYEKHLIRLDSSSKGASHLMFTAKRAVNRDFKLALNGGSGGTTAAYDVPPRQPKRAREGAVPVVAAPTSAGASEEGEGSEEEEREYSEGAEEGEEELGACDTTEGANE